MPRVKKVEEKVAKTRVVKPVVKKTGGLSVPIFSLLGETKGNFELPKAIFGVEVNKRLLAQALRVYLNNQKSHFASTKTRGEVEGSTRKIYRQKGTGGARHGAVRAPIFVGGGVALGPKFRDMNLELPKKMKKAALMNMLSQKAKDAGVSVLDSLEKASGKTQEMAKFVKKLGVKNILIVSGETLEELNKARLALKNLQNAELKRAEEINVYDVVRYESIVLTKKAVENLEKRLLGEETKESKETSESKVKESGTIKGANPPLPRLRRAKNA